MSVLDFITRVGTSQQYAYVTPITYKALKPSTNIASSPNLRLIEDLKGELRAVSMLCTPEAPHELSGDICDAEQVEAGGVEGAQTTSTYFSRVYNRYTLTIRLRPGWNMEPVPQDRTMLRSREALGGENADLQLM